MCLLHKVKVTLSTRSRPFLYAAHVYITFSNFNLIIELIFGEKENKKEEEGEKRKEEMIDG